jgi:parallel beta-helix repeat protein
VFRRTPLALTALAALLSFGAAPALATGSQPIVVKGSIQDAIDAASPGDTIFVPRGTYAECPVVAKDRLTIVGPRNAVIDASGCQRGLTVGTGSITTDPGTSLPVCPPVEIHDFTLKGLTIENADFTGVFLIGVEKFHVTGGRYVANAEYGIFPRCSDRGLIDWNSVEGAGVAQDAGIYVGVDDDVDVEHNFASGSPIGIEVENSHDTRVRWNVSTNNTAAMLVVVLPKLPVAATEDVLVEGNVFVENNHPNPFAPDEEDDIAKIPTGTGILNVGADGVVIRGNWITDNHTVGVAILQNPFAPEDLRIDPFPDDGVVRNNVIVKNGTSPDPARPSPLVGDIVYDGSSATQCFANNVFQTEFPAGITEAFPCP